MFGLNPRKFYNRIFHEKNSVGDNYYYIDGFNSWDEPGEGVDVALNHPILTPALLFISKLFAQADFHIENKSTGEKIYNHNILDVLNNPNVYQSKADLLQNVMFTKKANGAAVIYVKRAGGFNDEVDSLYTLDYSKIAWPKSFKTKMTYRSKDLKVLNQTILYDKGGLNLEIKLADLIFINDLPNGVDSKNILKVKSVIKGLSQTLKNTNDSLIAKNIILKTNGKDIISSNKNNDFPLSPKEKNEAEKLANRKYGLGFNRTRTIVTKASLTWQSMHIALRDLGLDESVKTDSNIIYTALHIPKDIISLEAKKTTYNNFKESMTSFIQNQMQSDIKDFADTLSKALGLDNDLKLVASYEHLPIMQYILIERYKGIILRGEALMTLIQAGLPKKLALKECGYDENIKLKPVKKNEKAIKQHKAWKKRLKKKISELKKQAA